MRRALPERPLIGYDGGPAAVAPTRGGSPSDPAPVFNSDSTAAKCDYCGAAARLVDTTSWPTLEKSGWASFRGQLLSTRHVCPGCAKGKKGDVRRDRTAAGAPSLSR